jgi:hypothetical protein
MRVNHRNVTGKFFDPFRERTFIAGQKSIFSVLSRAEK